MNQPSQKTCAAIIRVHKLIRSKKQHIPSRELIHIPPGEVGKIIFKGAGLVGDMWSFPGNCFSLKKNRFPPLFEGLRASPPFFENFRTSLKNRFFLATSPERTCRSSSASILEASQKLVGGPMGLVGWISTRWCKCDFFIKVFPKIVVSQNGWWK